MISQIVHYVMTVPPRLRAQSDTESQGAFKALAKGRVLIVDDEYLVALNIEEILVEAGHAVIGVVATGEEAVQQAILSQPDLVLMDIRLAGNMSGIEAALQLREKGIPSIFASAHSDQGTRVSGQEAKPLGWLAKPYSASEVVSAVADALARLRSH